MKKYIAELIGTFALVFCGTGAIVINDLSEGIVTHLGIGITFGLIVMSMIYTFGDISGAHLNPAVTFAFWFAGRFPLHKVFPYILSQLIGAAMASGLLKYLFPDHLTLGATLPTGPPLQSFLLEIILSLLLMQVILHVATGPNEKGITAGAAIGAVVMLEAIFAGPISGASMNPARSLAPAIMTSNHNHQWIYLLAPLIGSCLAVLFCRCVKNNDCCPMVSSCCTAKNP